MELNELLETPPWEWPRDAGSTFHRYLIDKSADISDRLIAAQLAGDTVVINDELAGDLMAIVSAADEPDDLRGSAAIALGPIIEQTDLDGFDDPRDIDGSPIEESTFNRIQHVLEKTYRDTSVPKEVRRRALEASVRAGQPWHTKAVKEAFASGDRDWWLTAVFATRFVRGFDKQILEGLKSKDEEIHSQAVQAAGANDLAPAAPHIIDLIRDDRTPKPLLLAAIEAIGNIRPEEAGSILGELLDSDDEEIADAAHEAVSMADAFLDVDEDEEDEDQDAGQGGWIN